MGGGAPGHAAAVPGALFGVVRKALSKKPEDRFKNAEEFAQNLRAWKSLETGTFPASAGAGEDDDGLVDLTQ